MADNEMEDRATPLVSILTPCYKSRHFLRNCLESVATQDYPRIEHIVQDGKSDDGTVELLESYGDRVNWLSEPDKGQADGLNRALQRCAGDIILVLNADDELLPEAVSWTVNEFAKHPDIGVIYGDQCNVDTENMVQGYSYGPRPYDFATIFCVEDVIPAQAAFIRRSALEKSGFYVDVDLPTCPDYEWWVRIGLNVDMLHVPRLLCAYRWHDGSETQQESMIKEMISAKRMVMDRAFADDTHAEKVSHLQSRAYSGLLWWGGRWMIQHGRLRGTISYGIQSLSEEYTFSRLFDVIYGAVNVLAESPHLYKYIFRAITCIVQIIRAPFTTGGIFGLRTQRMKPFPLKEIDVSLGSDQVTH